jgi:L-threonylcarbamoyladenylate synthase
LSVVLPSGGALSYLDQGKSSLAVRIPGDPTIQALLRLTGPLLTSSANQPGEQPAQNVAAAQQAFGETVDFYVDGGLIQNALPSTVVRVTETGEIAVLRQGAAPVPVKEQ